MGEALVGGVSRRGGAYDGWSQVGGGAEGRN